MDLDTFDELKSRLNLTGMGKPVLIGVVAILVMVAVAAGRLLIGTATANEFEIVKGGGGAVQVSQQDGRDAAPPEPETLFVHVSGEVAQPGLVEVAAGARVADAVQAAGGFTEDAATGSVNLARVLSDGEQVVIAGKAEGEPATSAPAASPQTAPAASQAGPSLVNINTAGAAELVELPGIGEATAAKIVADRQANGAYKTVDDLKRVSGIGDKKFEALADLICV